MPLAGEPQKFAIDLDKMVQGMSQSPDGRRLLFVANAGQPGLENGVLENFLPTLKASK